MERFDILDTTIDILQSRFLEASAGTGKTFTIEHLVIRLLTESSFALSEILAVTFTKEAANEMKTRIRSKLKTLANDVPAAREALLNFDEVQIFTIHGFCHQMLAEFAFEAMAPLNMRAVKEENSSSLIRETIEDFFRTGSEKFAPEVTYLLKSSRFDIDSLIYKITQALQKEEKSLPLIIPELPSISAEDLTHDFYALAPRYKWLDPSLYTEQLKKFPLYLESLDPSILLEEKAWFFSKMLESRARLRATPFDEVPLRHPSFFKTLLSDFLPYVQALTDPEQILKRVAEECFKRWKVKAERGDHFTFDGLLKTMEKAIDQPSFVEKVQQKYKAVIIDEFQDTDPLQWKIFERLFLEKHLLYLVGDPKQSIYGFRSADIYTYMSAASRFGQEKKVYLDTNYRSSPQLIDALNSLFTQRSDWIDLPSLPGMLTYRPVRAGRAERKIAEEPIIYFGAREKPSRERSFPTKTLEESHLFPFIAQEIFRLHTQKDIPLEECAVLVKDRYQGQRLQLHFNRWKIPSFFKRTFNLCDSRGFQLLQTMLKATLRPDDDRVVRTALPFLSIETNPFFQLKQLFSEKGFASFLKECTELLSDSYGELRQIGEILLQLPHPTLPELIHYMDGLKMTTPEEDERLKLHSEEGENKVQILTTFASKGLEFDVVFALGMASRYNVEETDPELLAEKMRQLYVAFTRPREKLYIPLVFADEPTTKPSPIELFFKDVEVPIEWVGQIPIQELHGERKEIPLQLPPAVDLHFPIETVTSFSGMATPSVHDPITVHFMQQDLTEKTSHTLPLGAETGTLIHLILETHFQDRAILLENVVLETLNGTHLEEFEEAILKMIEEVLALPLFDNFCLNDLKAGEYFQEMEFLFPKGSDFVKGFIDLAFLYQDTFYIVDWKTNWLGPSDADYSEANMRKAIAEQNYDLQAKLYGEAVRRFVKPLYKNPRFGGAYYIFVRGKKGVHLGDC